VPLSLGLQLQERARRLVGLNLFASIATVTLSIVFVVPLGRGVAGLFEGRVVAQALVLVAFALQYPLRGLLRFDRGIARELLRLGLPMVPAFASAFLQLQSSRYLLSFFRDLDTVGVFSVGTTIGFSIGLAVSAFSTAWTPFFMSFEDRLDEARPLFARVTTYFVLGFGLVLIFTFAGARAAVMILTRPAFHEAYHVVGLAAAAYVFLGVAGLFMVPAAFARDVGSLSTVQWVAALLTVGAGLVLIPLFGLIGAASALALGPLLLAALLHGWNRRRGERYLQIPYEWGRMARFAALAAALALPFTWARSLPLAAECALATAAGLAGIAVTWLALSPAERRAVQGYLRRGPGPELAT
jgi:O-antigen/teichoic acid export membrane protein